MQTELNLYEYAQILIRAKKFIGIFVLSVVLVTLVICIRMKNIYRAEATLMPIGSSSGGGLSALIAQMGLGGLVGGGGDSSSGITQIIAILRSQSLAENVISKYGLQEMLMAGVKNPDVQDAVSALLTLVKVKNDELNHLVLVSVDSTDPKFAADLVNHYVEGLTNYITQNAFTTSKRNRLFIEHQLERNRAELLELGKELSMYYANNRISNVKPMVDVDVSEKLDNKGYLEGLQKKTEALMDKDKEAKAVIDQYKIVKDVPQQVYLQYLSVHMDLLGQINTLLSNQYEIAKIDEAKNDLNYQVIDYARVPKRKIAPIRKRILMISMIVSFFAAVFLVFTREYIKGLKEKN